MAHEGREVIELATLRGRVNIDRGPVIEVHARLERAVNHSFLLTTLFQYPTIQTLSAFLDSKGNIGTDFAGINERALRQRVARAQRQEMRTRK